MKLIVKHPKGEEWFEQCQAYETDNGELDIYNDQSVIVATFSALGWYFVKRELDEGEDWPDSLRMDTTDTPEYRVDDSKEEKPKTPIEMMREYIGKDPLA